MSEIEIRRFTKDVSQKMGELYRAVTSRDKAVFWWVGKKIISRGNEAPGGNHFVNDIALI